MPRRLVLVLALLVLGGVARAGESEWRAQYREGSRLFDGGDYRGALDAFKRAWALHEDAQMLFDIGECERLLGDKTEAVHAYRGYLRRRPDAQNRQAIEALIAQLESPPSPSTAKPAPPPAPSPPPPPSPAPAPAPAPAPQAMAAPAQGAVPAQGAIYDPWHRGGAPLPVAGAPTPTATSEPAAPPPPAPGAAPPSEPQPGAPPPTLDPYAQPGQAPPPAYVATAPPPERKKSKAWIAAVVVPSVAVLAVIIGVSAWYASPPPPYTKLDPIQ